ESLVYVSASMLSDNVGKEGERFYPFIFTLFLFVVMSNLIGLVPYSFTITSHIIVTFSLAIMIFTGVNVIGFKKHGSEMLCLFLPGGTSIALAFLLVPIELISYIFKPISLSVRLFANMMAGHTLLKVIAGFAWSMLSAGGLLFVFHIVPLAVIIVLMGLELGVALIQAYVFSILSCIFLNDTLHMH
ncbi:MAG: F0F1 ATP synthase subunit A, partial [Cyanobacteria bacterium J06600_6]